MSKLTESQDPLPTASCHLIYDRECRLCVSIKNRLSQTTHTSEVQFVPYDSKEAKSLLGKAYVPGRPPIAYLIDAEGKKHQGLDAFIPLLPNLPWVKWVLPLWRFSLVRLCSHAVYRVIARYRYAWFGSTK